MNRTLQPPFKKSLDFNLPIPEKVKAVGDSEIWYLPSKSNEVVKIEIAFKAGKYFEKNIGEAQLTLNLLEKGTKTKTAQEIANQLDYYGSHLELKVGYDFSFLSLYALSRNVEQLLPLLFSIIQEPIFPENEIELLKNITKENLLLNLSKNEYVASNLIRQNLYGSHPYGRSISLNDLNNISSKEIKEFFRNRIRPYKIFIVGNLELETVNFISNNIDLLIQDVKDEVIEIPEIPYGNNRLIVDGPSKQQASIRIGKRTISRKHPDWGTLQFCNHVLGGYFGSRLMKNIREEKGLTYGIYSSINPLQYSSFINISAEVNSLNIDLAINEIFNELKSLSTIDSKELQLAKNHFIGSMQNDITTIFAASDQIRNIILNKLSFNFYKQLINQIDSLNGQDLHNIIHDQFQIESFTSIAVK